MSSALTTPSQELEQIAFQSICREVGFYSGNNPDNSSNEAALTAHAESFGKAVAAGLKAFRYSIDTK